MNFHHRKLSVRFVALSFLATACGLLMTSASASAATKVRAHVEIKVEPIQQNKAEASKNNDDRTSAIDKALEQALAERAKSQSAYERHVDRLAARPAGSDTAMRAVQSPFDLNVRDSSDSRAQLGRDSREDQRREKRLNWLND